MRNARASGRSSPWVSETSPTRRPVLVFIIALRACRGLTRRRGTGGVASITPPAPRRQPTLRRRLSAPSVLAHGASASLVDPNDREPSGSPGAREYGAPESRRVRHLAI